MIVPPRSWSYSDGSVIRDRTIQAGNVIVADVLNEEDGKLIAALPEILHALVGAREWFDDGQITSPQVIARIDAAIAKAGISRGYGSAPVSSLDLPSKLEGRA